MRQRKRVIVDPAVLREQVETNDFDSRLLEKLSQSEILLIEDPDLCKSYEVCYENTQSKKGWQKAELHLCQTILANLIVSEHRPRQKIQISNANISKEIRNLIDPLPPLYQSLIMAACQDSNIIVVILDNLSNYDPTLLLDIRAQLSILLMRDVILHQSEFVKPAPFLITEGKSDWKHLKAALRWLREKKKFIGHQITFHEYSEDMGDQKLLKKCKASEELNDDANHDPLETINVCIFDRDTENIVREVSKTGNEHEYKKWSQKFFSFSIPVPLHRADSDMKFYVCIEFYYQDNEIKLIDKDGRRLFISSEFDQKGSIQGEGVRCTDNRYQSKKPLIIDTGVERISDGRSIALGKDDFANKILNYEPPFDNIDFSPFELVFEVVKTIIDENF